MGVQENCALNIPTLHTTNYNKSDDNETGKQKKNG